MVAAAAAHQHGWRVVAAGDGDRDVAAVGRRTGTAAVVDADAIHRCNGVTSAQVLAATVRKVELPSDGTACGSGGCHPGATDNEGAG